MAVTILAACALQPPKVPAIEEPIRFLPMFRSTSALAVVLSIFLTAACGTIASLTTDLPLPSILKNKEKMLILYNILPVFNLQQIN